MDRWKKWLALFSITTLVLLTLLGGIVSALAGEGEAVPGGEQPAVESIESGETEAPAAEPAEPAAEEASGEEPAGEAPAAKEAPAAEEEAGEPAPPSDGLDGQCCRKGKVTGYKFLDANKNGIMDEGEEGMAGVTILLDGGAYSVVTPASGYFEFGDLDAGTYEVSEEVPAGYVATTDTSFNIELECGETAVVFFGNAPEEVVIPGFISGTKWNDLDGDGELNEEEPPLPGVTIELWKDGEKIAETVTDENGDYSFTDLEAGIYTVKEVLSGDWYAVDPASGMHEDIELLCGESIDDVDFLNHEEELECNYGVVEVLVWADCNNNGELDAGEQMIDGVTARLYHVTEGGWIPADGYDGPYQKQTGPGGYGMLAPWGIFTFPPWPGGWAGWMNLPLDYNGGLIPSSEYAVEIDVPAGYYAPEGNVRDGLWLRCPLCWWKQVGIPLKPYVSIDGTKWEDSDCDGQPDGPVEGVTIELWKDGEKVDETVTDENGDYSFTDLEAGIYTVKEVLSGDWYAVDPASGMHEDIELLCGESIDDVDFLNARYLSIEGNKWEDLNCNGEHDEGEPPVEGITIELLQEDVVIDTTTTAADGSYSFTGLLPGTYTVREVLPEDWYPKSPDDGAYEDIELVCGESIDDIDFLNARYLSIEGNKWEDLNCNGEHDEGEPPVEGITIELLQEDVVIDTTTTAADGSYSFTGLLPGTYTVREVLPEDWYPKSPDDGAYEDIELVCGQPIEGLDFLNARYGSICGIKFLDTDEDGIMDEGEEGMDGVLILLNGGEDSALTADGGKFCFEDLLPGTYEVSVDESSVPGYYPTTPNPIEVELGCGQNLEVFFGNAPYGSISGTKWLDANTNGIWDAEETEVIEGITIKLYEGDPPGALIAETTTDENGEYSFTDLKPGTYTVVEEGGDAYFSVTADSVVVNLSGGEGAVVDFGNCPYGRVEGLKFLDLDGDGVQDPGEPGLEGVTVTLSGEGAMAVTTTGEDGTFVFNKLLPGEYTVAETVPSGYYATRPISVPVIVEPAESVSVIFANALYGSISGTKWIDANGDGILDDGESPYAEGLTITLYGETLTGDIITDERTTGSDGTYSFTLLEAGDYTISEVVPENMTPTSDVSVPVELDPGEEATGVDFLNSITEVGGEVITPPAGGALPYTGLEQLPLLIAAGVLMLLGLVVLAMGYRRRLQE